MAKKERKLLNMSFSLNLELFRASFGRKIGCHKLAKSKANPLPKCQFLAKNGHFLEIFFEKKTSPNGQKRKEIA